MTPTEKAIQSRIKEAFSYKVNNRLWEKIMEGIKTHSKFLPVHAQHNHAGSNPQSSSYFHKPTKTQRYQHLHGSDEYQKDQHKFYGSLPRYPSRNVGVSKTGGSMRMSNSNSKYITTRSGKKLYHVNSEFKNEQMAFELEEDLLNTEVATELKTYLIYPSGERWVGVDGKASEVDQHTYKEFVGFLEEYFTGDLDEFWKKNSPIDNLIVTSGARHQKGINSTGSNEMNPIGMPNANFDGNTRAIPGGRYGCAQFVKSCGPPILKKVSLGQFSQMIQKAISDDLLRYQKKTLLVWTASIDKDINCGVYSQEEIILKREEIIKKLAAVKMAIIDTLLKNPEGISLAQLPNHFKTRLNFTVNLNDLGFAKLKDLITSMRDRVMISNNNHPVATLIRPNKINHSANSSEDIPSFTPYPPGYYPMSYNKAYNPQRMSSHNDMEYLEPYSDSQYYNAQYQNYMSNYNSNGNVSFGSFYSQTERHNFKARNHSSDVKNYSSGSAYVPHASSLYGSVCNTSHIQAKTNVGH